MESGAMKIGLLRHFKVDHHSPGLCNSRQYNRSCGSYDEADILPPLEAKIYGNAAAYPVCYVSSLKRAVQTAKLVFPGETVIRDELKEIPLRAMFQTRLKLPFRLWNVINRLGWGLNSKRVPETRKQTEARVNSFLNEIFQAGEDVLIVSHGLFLATLQVRLSGLGFMGDDFFRAEHGQLYEFEKNWRSWKEITGSGYDPGGKHIALVVSFEAEGYRSNTVENANKMLIRNIYERAEQQLPESYRPKNPKDEDFRDTNEYLTAWCDSQSLPVVLFADEIDASREITVDMLEEAKRQLILRRDTHPDRLNLAEGFLVIFDPADKTWDEKIYYKPIDFKGKRIIMVGV